MSAGASVVDFEITRRLSDLALPEGPSALVLFRLHGRPLGWGSGRVTDGRLDGAALVRQFLHQHAWTCALPLAERAVQGGRPLRTLDATTLLQSPPPSVSSGTLVTVAVRSRYARESTAALPRLVVASRLPGSRSRADRCVRRSEAGRGAGSRALPPNQVQQCARCWNGIASRDRRVSRRHPRRDRWRCCCRPAVGLRVRQRVPLRPRSHDGQWPRAPTLLASSLQADATCGRTLLPALVARSRRLRIDRRCDSARVGACQLQRGVLAPWRGRCPRGTREYGSRRRLVRTLAITPTSHPSTGRGSVRTLDRHVDLRDGVVPISDASTYDALRLRVTWVVSRSARCALPITEPSSADSGSRMRLRSN